MKVRASSSRWSKSASTAIENTAADWFARRDAGLCLAELVQLNAWLSIDVRHAAAFAELEAAWADFNRPRREGRGEALFQAISARAAEGKRRARHVAVYATAGLAAAASLAFAFLPSATPPSTAVASIALRPDRQVLPDGSSVELNAGASFVVEFTPERRAIRIVRGEALFDVIKDPTRPFVVIVSQVEVRAVGTAFTVRQAHDEIGILVTEGQVAVDRIGPPLVSHLDQAVPDEHGLPSTSPTLPVPIYVDSGRKVTIPLMLGIAAPETKEVSIEEVAEALAWRSRRVEFTSTPLNEAVAFFNRQSGKRLVLGNDETRALRITGVFWTDDPEGFSRLLVSSLGLKAEADDQGRIVLR